MSDYTPQFRLLHKRLGRKIPIHIFANSIGKQLCKDERDIYNPVTVYLKVAGDIPTLGGLIKLHVPIHESDWYNDLCLGVAKMMRIPESAFKNIDIRTMVGIPIKTFNRRQLERAGELDIYFKNKLKRLAELPEPPKELSTKKPKIIRDWFENLKSQICDVVSKELEHKSLVELDQALGLNGPVNDKIKQIIMDKTPQITGGLTWDKFSKTYKMDHSSNDEDSSKVMEEVSKVILAGIRNGMRASEEEVKSFYAMKEKEKFKNNNIIEKPLFNIVTSSKLAKRTGKDGRNMYYDIVFDSLNSPVVTPNIVKTIYQRPINDHLSRKYRKYHKHHRGQHYHHHGPGYHRHRHPYRGFLHNLFYPLYGYYPAHYLSNHNKKDDVEKPYVGNAIVTNNFHNIYSGNHPIPVFKKFKPSPPVEDSVPSFDHPIPKLIPIKEVFPTIGENIEIDDKCPDPVYIEDEISHLPDLVPIEDEMALPDLIPIKKNITLPDLVPIKEEFRRKMPKGIPLNKEEDFSQPLFSSQKKKKLPTLDDFL